MEGGQEAYLLSDTEGLPEVHEARPAANQPPISTRLWSPRIAVASTSLLGKFSDAGMLRARSFVQPRSGGFSPLQFPLFLINSEPPGPPRSRPGRGARRSLSLDGEDRTVQSRAQGKGVG